MNSIFIVMLVLFPLQGCSKNPAKQSTANGSANTASSLWLPSIFCDHMVVQQGEPIRIWGKAAPGSQVRIHLNNRETIINADENGRWQADLDPLSVGKPYTMAIRTKEEQKVIEDILSGEVWYASGQSNMEYAMSRIATREEIKDILQKADVPALRLFKTERRNALEKQEDVGGNWVLSTEETAKEFSAVAYIFGFLLNKRLDVPVGIIVSAVGATSIQAWMDRELPEAINTRINGNMEKTGYFHKGMTAGLQPYRIKGMLWYQGENNAVWFDPRNYGMLMLAFIDDIRKGFQNPQLPFLFVQLPAYEALGKDWASLREEQAKVARLMPNTGMAVTIDLGEEKDIHPRDKYPVAERLYRMAMHQVYKMDRFVGFPEFSRTNIKDGRFYIAFKNYGEGLVSTQDAEIPGFEICGPEGVFHPVPARISGLGAVELITDEKVSAVRYAWKNWIRPVLFNKEGLPVAPFWHVVME